ncbi:high affinity immunoglobulin gamma Fc receptor I-like isoform X2 [Xyrichtys novacula]|nr:high affinity immunoglobulin gamma Fc receptor I-like isoform X2 [Xyrichtys novacula]
MSNSLLSLFLSVLVILQGPVHPVMEGDDVTLNCSSKGSRTAADFYRGNSLIRTEPTGLMTIQNVSKAHEGAYKCRINDMKDSEPSWLLMEDGSGPVSLSVSPDSSHTFEYENLTLSCGKDSRSRGWRVIRASYPKLKLSTCGNGWGYPTGSGCFFNTTKKSDSAIYWCESPRKQRSNSVDITVHGPEKDVVLQSPVLPVTVGDNVTLSCRTRTSTKHHAEFYNGENNVGTGPAGHMTIPSVSLSAEGQYWCKVKDHKKSPPSWLFVRDPNLQLQSTRPLPAVIPKLVVVILFLICTVLTVRSWKSQHYRLGPPGRTRPVMIPLSPPLEDPPGLDDPYDDVMADITTEHHF